MDTVLILVGLDSSPRVRKHKLAMLFAAAPDRLVVLIATRSGCLREKKVRLLDRSACLDEAWD